MRVFESAEVLCERAFRLARSAAGRSVASVCAEILELADDCSDPDAAEMLRKAAERLADDDWRATVERLADDD